MDDQRTKRSAALKSLAAKRQAAKQALDSLMAAYVAELDEIKNDGIDSSDLVPLYGSIMGSLDLLDLRDLIRFRDVLKFKVIPETFDRDGVRVLTTTEGDRIHITSEILASIPAEERDAAYKWLRDNNHGDLIRDWVFPMTLKAFAKSWREDSGQDFPPEAHIKVEVRDTTTYTPNKVQR